MKKLLSLLLVLALLGALGAPALAADIGINGGTTGDVTGTFNPGDEIETVYSVDISWDAMNFYFQADDKTWDPDKHEYVDATTGTWLDSDANIYIVNHSNTAIVATPSFTAEEDVGDVTMTFDCGEKGLRLESADNEQNSTMSVIPQGQIAVTPGGTLNKGVIGKIGDITVTITEAVAKVSTEEELVAALAEGGEIVLTADITMTGDFPAFDNATVNLNGYTLTPDPTLDAKVTAGTLTLTGDGTVNGDVHISQDGTVNLQGGNVSQLHILATANISGGSVSVLNANPGCSVTISGGSVDVIWTTDGSSVTISGGHVRLLNEYGGDLTITGGTFGDDPTDYLAEGYTATEADGIWTVTAN